MLSFSFFSHKSIANVQSTRCAKLNVFTVLTFREGDGQSCLSRYTIAEATEYVFFLCTPHSMAAVVSDT